MVIKIVLAVSLVGFLVFEVFNLVSTIRQRKRAKQQRIAEQQALEDTEKSNKEEDA